MLSLFTGVSICCILRYGSSNTSMVGMAKLLTPLLSSIQNIDIMVVRSRKNSKFLPEVVDKLFEILFETLYHPVGDPRRVDPLWVQFENNARKLISKINAIDPLEFRADDSAALATLVAQLESSAALLLKSSLYSELVCRKTSRQLEVIVKAIDLEIAKSTAAMEQ